MKLSFPWWCFTPADLSIPLFSEMGLSATEMISASISPIKVSDHIEKQCAREALWAMREGLS